MLLTSGKLNEYLADVDKQAEERFEKFVKQELRKDFDQLCFEINQLSQIH